MANTQTDLPATLSELLARTLQAHGNRPAVIDSRKTLSWREIADLAEGYAGQLHNAGVCRGDRVALWLPNSADYLALIFAVARLGAIALHINSRFRAHEVGSLLRRTTPAVLVTDFGGAPDYAEVIAQVPDTDKASLTRILTRGTTSSMQSLGHVPVDLLRAAGSIRDAARPDESCAIFTTTGSTGEPKLVLHGQRGLAGPPIYAAQRLEFDEPGAVLLANLPFCGIYGFSRMMMAVAGGGGIALQDSADIATLIRRRRVTHMSGFADVLAWLIKSAAGRPYESMRIYSVGSSPFVDNTAVFAAAEALGLRLRTGYVSTEIGHNFFIAPDGWGTAPGGTLVQPRSRFAIRDPDSGLELPEGEPGALLLASTSLFLGYYNDPALTAAAWTEDGMFRTGDRGYRRGDGFVYLGRYDDTLRLGGFLVDPAEIETFLRLQPGIAAARVVGASANGVLRAVAFVVAREGHVPNEPALLEACREQIAAYKVPARIVTLDEFPISEGANGRKIRLNVLSEMATTLLRDDSSH